MLSVLHPLKHCRVAMDKIGRLNPARTSLFGPPYLSLCESRKNKSIVRQKPVTMRPLGHNCRRDLPGCSKMILQANCSTMSTMSLNWTCGVTAHGNIVALRAHRMGTACKFGKTHQIGNPLKPSTATQVSTKFGCHQMCHEVAPLDNLLIDIWLHILEADINACPIIVSTRGSALSCMNELARHCRCVMNVLVAT